MSNKIIKFLTKRYIISIIKTWQKTVTAMVNVATGKAVVMKMMIAQMDLDANKTDASWDGELIIVPKKNVKESLLALQVNVVKVKEIVTPTRTVYQDLDVNLSTNFINEDHQMADDPLDSLKDTQFYSS